MGMERASIGGTLVVLNGASSAGKTVTAEALLPLLGPGAVHTGFDQALARAWPFGPEPATRGGRIRRGVRILAFHLTNGRVRLAVDLHREVAALVRAGRPVVLDTVLVKPAVRDDAAARFAPLGGLFVEMKPPLAVSERWETAGDRPSGHARRHYNLVHMHDTYDLVLDPSVLTPEQCAQAIAERLAAGPAPSAFRQLSRGSVVRAEG